MAEAVGRPVYELEEEMPLSEVKEWQAYWRLKAEAERKASEKAQREARLKRRRK